MHTQEHAQGLVDDAADAFVDQHEVEADEFLRFNVPQPETELVLGRGPNNFVGIMGRVKEGGVFLGAGGFFGFLPTADSTYEGFKKAHTTISVGIGGTAAVIQVARALVPRFDGVWPGIDLIGGGIGLLLSGIVPAAAAIASQGVSTAEGNVSVYGDSGVSLVSPISCSMTGGLSGSVNGTFASINAIVSATVNGVAASVNGIAGSVNGVYASVNGSVETTLAAKAGQALVLGDKIHIGQVSHIANPGYIDKPLLSASFAKIGFLGNQKATRTIDVSADESIALSAGTPIQRLAGVPKLTFSPESVRAESLKATFEIGKAATLTCGTSVVDLSPTKALLATVAAPPRAASVAAIKVADEARDLAHKAADEVYHQVEWTDEMRFALKAAAVTALVGVHGGASAAGLNETAGAVVGGTLIGGAAAGLGLGSAVSLVTKIMAGKARTMAKKLADKAHATAVKAASAAEALSIMAQAPLPTSAVVETSPTGVKLAFGLSSIAITPAGIELKTPGILKIDAMAISSTAATVTDLS